ncbi:outer membrane beta-barrel protein [Gemmatimonas groenlandica]|uniref:Porin family protein n=1 Tax=Gemmatimonas groenlandica TaxID=2732249 RepID=A0A6M4IT66_9BACT|nr:outer membrane beta-barrel protein [Gemmatimonas groenlandica]QJR36676.1 porin family protein [Gemmatimonas groenlandica]
MNRFSKFVTVAALMMTPAMVSAQSSAVGFGVSGGLSVPTGDLGDAVDAGYSIAGHVFLKPASTKNLRFRGDVSYTGFDYKNIDASYRSLGFVGNALLDLSSSGGVKPYVLGGVGAFNGKASTKIGSAAVVSTSSTDVGIQVGGGLNFQLSGFSTFLELKYVNVFTDGNSAGYIPITFGVRF